jgi:hypothetical protein
MLQKYILIYKDKLLHNLETQVNIIKYFILFITIW